MIPCAYCRKKFISIDHEELCLSCREDVREIQDSMLKEVQEVANGYCKKELQ